MTRLKGEGLRIYIVILVVRNDSNAVRKQIEQTYARDIHSSEGRQPNHRIQLPLLCRR